MAKAPKPVDYLAKVSALGWPELLDLWKQIEVRDTPDWAPGKAFEHLTLRAFELEGATVT